MKSLPWFCLLTLCACASPQAPTTIELEPAGWIPFDFLGKEHILLSGTVNGHPVEIVLDSGAEVSLIDSGFAKSIGATLEGHSHVSGTAGSIAGSIAKGLQITAGNMTLSDAKAAVIDLRGFTALSGRQISLVLGAEAFMAAVIEIDYANQQVNLHDSEGFTYSGKAEPFNIHPLEKGRHAIAASIEGHAQAKYLIDTGSGSTTAVYPALAKRQSLLVDRALVSGWISLGVGGIIHEITTSVNSLVLGNFKLEDVPISIPADPSGQLAEVDFEGVIGNEVLSRFGVVFDFGHNRIYLEPAADWQTRAFVRDLVGLALLPKGEALQVLFVAPGSPAEAAGWRAGMSVEAVNGMVGSPLERRAEIKRLMRRKEGGEISLVDGDGVDRSVICARYN